MGFMSRDKGDPLTSPASPKTWRKKVVIAICVVVLGAAGYGTYRALTPQNTTYLTVPVTKGRITDVVQASGTVKPLQEADLKFKNDGVLQSLVAKVGLNAAQGQELAVQDDADLRTAVDQAANEVTQTEYKLQQSELDLEKAKSTASQQEALYKGGAISQSDFEQSQRDYKTAVINWNMAKASIGSARVKLQIAQNTLKDAILSAPFSGTISSVTGEVGQDSSIVAIHMISPQLQVVAQVNEADISRVKVNQKAYLTLASENNKRVSGVVKQISPQAQTVNNIQLYEVSINVNDTDKLLMPGMSVTANIVASESSSERALVQNIAFTYAQTFKSSSTVNNSSDKSTTNTRNKSRFNQGSAASRQTTAQTAKGNTSSGQTATQTTGTQTTRRVVVLKNGQPVVKTVQTGLSDGSNTEVISGLEPGEQVIIGTSDGSSDSSNNTSSGSTKSNSNRSQDHGPGGPMF